jgi:hypothetical protein
MAEIRVNATGELKLYDSDDSNYVSFKSAGTVSSNVAWVLPSADGSSGQMLSTDGSGTLSWATASSADPSSADGDSLGTASAEWSDLYLADAGVIYFGNDQDITLTHVPDTGLILGGTTPTLTIGDAGAEDTKIQFDGNAQDFYIGLDDSGDEFQIGRGSTLGAGREFSIGASGPVFNEDSDTHDFRIETDDQTHAFFIHGANDEVSLNESASDTDPGGLCINHGSNDAASITLKNSDVAHGVTDQVETDTYAFIGKNAAANGGLLFMSFSEGDNCHTHEAFATSSNTTQNGSGGGPFKMNGRKKSGTGATAFGSGDNVFLVQNNGQTDFIVDGNGDIFYDGSASAYDSYDDAQLVRAFDIAKSTPGTIIQSKWDDFVQYKYDDLREAGILGNQTKEDDEKGIIPFTCVTKLQKLHNGAIWQQYEKHNQLLEAVYDLATIAVGEEKANAILDKHEVKRLQ